MNTKSYKIHIWKYGKTCSEQSTCGRNSWCSNTAMSFTLNNKRHVGGIWKKNINFNNLFPCQISEMFREQKLTHSWLWTRYYLGTTKKRWFESHSILWKTLKHNEKRIYCRQQGSASTTCTNNNFQQYKAMKRCWQPGRHVHWLAIKDRKSRITQNRFWIV